MAKKKPASKTPASQRKKTVSVKKIVAEINRRSPSSSRPRPPPRPSGPPRPGADPQSYALDRAIMSLRGARDVIEGTCVPGFDIPF